jgi:hypothetical protein
VSRPISWRSIENKGLRAYSTLTEAERTWYLVSTLTISVRNGSLISYYYNSGADNLNDLMGALERLGAEDMLQLVRRVNALFKEPVPKTLEGRNESMALWQEDGPEERALDEVAALELAAASKLDALIEVFSRDHGIEV